MRPVLECQNMTFTHFDAGPIQASNYNGENNDFGSATVVAQFAAAHGRIREPGIVREVGPIGPAP